MNIQKLMKQMQAMQTSMVQAQDRLAEQQCSAEGAGGKIKATANGAGELISLHIDPSIVDPEDVEFLETLILKTVQDALQSAKNMMEGEMRKMTGGFGLPR